MSNQEALTEIKERILVTEYVDSSYVDCVSIEALRIAIKALEQSEQRWVPCSERLPEVGQDVLFSVQDLFVSEGCLREDGDLSQFRWQAIQKKEAVTAWRPMPDPWGGEQS